MTHTPRIDRIEDDGSATPMLLRPAAQWEAMRAALAAIAADGCEYTGYRADDRSCYRRGDDDPCPACIARVALGEAVEP